jgi:hypothetical protein
MITSPMTLRARHVACVAGLAFLALSGCSSSTEPGASDALVSRITVSKGTVHIDGDLDAVWTVENAGATELVLTFNPQGSQGFLLGVSESDHTMDPEHAILHTIRYAIYHLDGHVLTLAPHQKMVFTATLRGAAVGSTSVDGCLPPQGTSENWVCVSKPVNVIP